MDISISCVSYSFRILSAILFLFVSDIEKFFSCSFIALSISVFIACSLDFLFISLLTNSSITFCSFWVYPVSKSLPVCLAHWFLAKFWGPSTAPDVTAPKVPAYKFCVLKKFLAVYDAKFLAISLTFFVFFIPTPLSLSNNASSTIGPKNSCKYSSVNSPFMLVNVFLTALFLINLSSTLEVILFVEFPNTLLP